MTRKALGRAYHDGEAVVTQGETGDCMYVVQQGRLEVVVAGKDGETAVGNLGPGDVFGEMALFTREPRSATVRSCGGSTVLTIDKRGFFRRVQEDPSLAFRILGKMSERISRLDQELLSITRRPPRVDGAATDE